MFIQVIMALLKLERIMISYLKEMNEDFYTVTSKIDGRQYILNKQDDGIFNLIIIKGVLPALCVNLYRFLTVTGIRLNVRFYLQINRTVKREFNHYGLILSTTSMSDFIEQRFYQSIKQLKYTIVMLF